MSENGSDSSWPSAEEDPATLYALKVVHGEQLAGKWVRLACERHLRDKAAAERGETKWRWRPELGNRAIGLFGLFRHYKGKWGGQPVILELWQKFIVSSIFSWVDRATGLRRFRNAFVEMPRGQGKSTLAAGILIILTFFDNESGAEGYSFATKKDQARIVFKTARQMIMRSPALRELITVQRHNLHDEDTESKLEALGANEDTLDGLRPHCAVGDEIHKHKTPDLVEVIESGMGTREQPLLFNITTAGEADGLESVYGQQVSISAQVLEGHAQGFELPEWFAYMASADPEDDWTLETTHIKANPNWGVSVNPEFVRKELRKALANPAEQPKFRRLYLGQRVQAVDAYFSLVDWDACPDLPPDEELRKYPSWIGLDLSSSVDVTAAVQVWKLGADEIAIRPMLWIPEDGLEDRRRKDKVPYPQWVSDGHMFTTPGNTIDRAAIRRKVVEVAKDWKVKAVCYDPWHADEMTQLMQDEDKITMIQVPQRFAMLSEPTKASQVLILRRRVRHDKNPAMRSHIGNAKPRIDDRENVMLCKKRSRGRIDGAQGWQTAMNQVKVLTKKKWAAGSGIIIGADGVLRNAVTGEAFNAAGGA
jgi:phage terminase large subunit-like protein